MHLSDVHTALQAMRTICRYQFWVLLSELLSSQSFWSWYASSSPFYSSDDEGTGEGSAAAVIFSSS